MIKSSQLYQLHLRLCEVKMSDKVMGGVSVLLFGKHCLSTHHGGVDQYIDFCICVCVYISIYHSFMVKKLSPFTIESSVLLDLNSSLCKII